MAPAGNTSHDYLRHRTPRHLLHARAGTIAGWVLLTALLTTGCGNTAEEATASAPQAVPASDSPSAAPSSTQCFQFCAPSTSGAATATPTEQPAAPAAPSLDSLQGTVAVTDEEGYTATVDWTFASSGYESVIADSPPGQTQLHIMPSTSLTVTNTTSGRNFTAEGIQLGLVTFYPAKGPACAEKLSMSNYSVKAKSRRYCAVEIPLGRTNMVQLGPDESGAFPLSAVAEQDPPDVPEGAAQKAIPALNRPAAILLSINQVRGVYGYPWKKAAPKYCALTPQYEARDFPPEDLLAVPVEPAGACKTLGGKAS